MTTSCVVCSGQVDSRLRRVASWSRWVTSVTGPATSSQTAPLQQIERSSLGLQACGKHLWTWQASWIASHGGCKRSLFLHLTESIHSLTMCLSGTAVSDDIRWSTRSLLAMRELQQQLLVLPRWKDSCK